LIISSGASQLVAEGLFYWAYTIELEELALLWPNMKAVSEAWRLFTRKEGCKPKKKSQHLHHKGNWL